MSIYIWTLLFNVHLSKCRHFHWYLWVWFWRVMCDWSHSHCHDYLIDPWQLQSYHPAALVVGQSMLVQCLLSSFLTQNDTFWQLNLYEAFRWCFAEDISVHHWFALSSFWGRNFRHSHARNVHPECTIAMSELLKCHPKYQGSWCLCFNIPMYGLWPAPVW